MKYELDGKEYNVKVVKKNNKNTYLRVLDDMTIYITTNYLTTNKSIIKLLDTNKDCLRVMLTRQSNQNKKKKAFFYLGREYDIIEVSIMDKVEVNDKYIYIPNKKKFDLWYKKELRRVFEERLKYNYERFKEIKKCPELKIRTMKTRWGVYNRVKHTITLNSHLLEYDYDVIDYVIIHELSHIIHFDHSKDFWALVSIYCPDYKKIRKKLKE